MSSRNASPAAAGAQGPTAGPTTGPGRGTPPTSRPTHLRQFKAASGGINTSSTSSHDQYFDTAYSNSPGGTLSSSSTLRERPSSRLRHDRLDRSWTVTVNESLARDEVLLNLDLVGHDIQPGCLVAIDVVRADSDKPPQTPHHHKHHLQGRKDGAAAAAAACVAQRYICVAKDMPKDLKARYSTVEVYVAKHIADAFGMRKGTQVTLTPVWPLGAS